MGELTTYALGEEREEMAKGQNVTTEEVQKSSEKKGRKGGQSTKAAAKQKAWPIDAALDILADTLNSVQASSDEHCAGITIVVIQATPDISPTPLTSILLRGVKWDASTGAFTLAEKPRGAEGGEG